MNTQLPFHDIRALMENSYSEYGDFPAISFVGDSPVSFKTLKKEVCALVVNLVDHGVQPGDRVAVLGENSPNWVRAYLAITSLGATAVPILPGFPDEDVRHIIRDAEVFAIFSEEKHMSAMEGFNLPTLRLVYALESNQCTEERKKARSELREALSRWKKQSGTQADPVEFIASLPYPGPDALAVIIYTSGTTGHSKGVMLTHGNIAYNVQLSIQRFPISQEDRFLSILPLSHTFEATGGLLCPLSVGTSIYYMKGLPTPQKLIAAMGEVKPTGVLTVPLVMDKIYRKRILPKFTGSAFMRALYGIPFIRKMLNRTAGKKLLKLFGGELRFFMFGGAALNGDVEQFLCDAGISYSTGYGMTETSPILTINPFGKVRVGSCGKPIPGIEIKIDNPNQNTGLGEIIIKGPNVMRGYIHNEEANSAIFMENGWLRTGDLGYFDEDGYLFIKGRSKHVIVGPNGENIFPEIVEQHLVSHPMVQETVVYQDNGRLVAMVYPDYDQIQVTSEWRAADQPEQREVIQKMLDSARKEVNEKLAHFSKIHRIIEQTEPFDKTPTNKVKRYLYIPKI
jgi:long-chain acyl-CoA synthetase